ncbi:hypothetical protein ACNSZH_11020 [Burkholderia gladioli]|uniref:hypothetical protein n=1 Tax=Burkholderia gladioli TaxID=28095 RepID=UPI003B9815EF
MDREEQREREAREAARTRRGADRQHRVVEFDAAQAGLAARARHHHVVRESDAVAAAVAERPGHARRGELDAEIAVGGDIEEFELHRHQPPARIGIGG